MNIPRQYKADVMKAIKRALKEDISDGDATTSFILTEDIDYVGTFMAKEPGIIAGLAVAEQVFYQLDNNIIFKPLVQDGDTVENRQAVATIEGPGSALLSGERTALNFLQRMSGIATLTHRYVQAVRGTSAKILDTRKTAPGLRTLDKWSVLTGGGNNHRYGLYDMILIKENHIEAAGGISAAIERVNSRNTRNLPVEIEVKNLEELNEALAFPVDRIMLDNMSPETMRKAVLMTKGKTELEASGNVNPDSVKTIAQTGVDYISIGEITHSVKALDISFLLQQK